MMSACAHAPRGRRRRPAAGMMGLPRAYRSLGSVLGTSLIIIVGGLTYWSMAVLVEGNERHARAQTYPSLARAACGPRVALAVRAAVLLFCFGFAVVYLVRGRGGPLQEDSKHSKNRTYGVSRPGGRLGALLTAGLGAAGRAWRGVSLRCAGVAWRR